MHKILPVKLDEVIMPEETNKLIENVEELDKRVIESNEKISSNKESIDTLASVVDANKETLDAEVLLLDKKIDTNTTELNNKIDTKSTELNNRIDENVSDISNNKESIEALSEVVEANKSEAHNSIAGLDNRVINLELAGGGEDMKEYLEANYYDKETTDGKLLILKDNIGNLNINKQNANENNLITASKNIVGAINELKTDITATTAKGTIKSGFNKYHEVSCTKISGFCTVVIGLEVVTPIPVHERKMICILPNGFHPASTYFYAGIVNGGSEGPNIPVQFEVNKDGCVYMSNANVVISVYKYAFGTLIFPVA